MQPPAPALQSVVPKGPRIALLEAIAAASAGFGDLTKDTDNSYLKSKYLGLPGLLKAIKPPLLEQGVVIYTQVLFTESGWVVRTTLAFVDGSEEISNDFPILDLSNQQKVASVITFGTRYNLFGLLAICPENDDDGNSGSYAAPAVAQLPGLPGGAPSWGGGPVQQPQAPQAMPPAMVYPVQPSPVFNGAY